MLALKRILYESATCCNVKSTVIYFIRILILRLVKEEMESNKKISYLYHIRCMMNNKNFLSNSLV